MSTLQAYSIILSMVVIAATAALGVWHTAFKDTFIQCISLSVICMTALGIAYQVLTCRQLPTFTAFAISLATYSLATIYKYWQDNKNGTTYITR